MWKSGCSAADRPVYAETHVRAPHRSGGEGQTKTAQRWAWRFLHAFVKWRVHINVNR